MSTKTNNEYLLLFRGDAWYNGLSPEELQKVMGHCKAWFEQLSEQGKVRGGQPLGREGAVVSMRGRAVADGPFAESKEAIGGYLLLQVDTLEEAVAIAKTNPTLVYGTTVEVRPVLEECPMNSRARQIGREEHAVLA